MMYGFGDEETPANDTVHVMEDLLGHFITDLVSAHHPFGLCSRRNVAR
jgi:hypothetical protein